ncbi:MAG: ribosome recycling factor [Deltaproteobacteria bacterium]|nr:ribosome recycling factor [Deltaproteobacteria bacterium]MDL1971946.1 ribosome recycling factor [Deltaproteobacteria bacterium]
MEGLFDETKGDMQRAIKALERDLSKIRTGRASVALVEEITVEYYGSPTPLNQLASISVPDSRLITIQPWDPSALSAIEKAILKSNIGLTPSNDGKRICINIPPLTEERRKELVKLVKKIGEEAKVSIRNLRRKANDILKKMKKNKEISEDDFYQGQEKIQKITDEFIEKVEGILSKKEDEIMKF